MVARIEYNDHGSFVRLAKAIKESGDARKWRGELRNVARRITRPTVNAIKKSARETLPKRGGLNRYVAANSVKTQVKTSGAGAGMGIRITVKRSKRGGSGQVNVYGINNGEVQHPVWGHRPYLPQGVPAGFVDNAIDEQTVPDLQTALRDAVDKLLHELS